MYLFLSHNMLSARWSSGWPAFPGTIRHLDLSYNLIAELPSDLFEQLARTWKIDLSHNVISGTLPDSIPNPELMSVDLRSQSGSFRSPTHTVPTGMRLDEAAIAREVVSYSCPNLISVTSKDCIIRLDYS